MTNYITKTIKNGVEANIPVTSVNWQYGDVTIQTGGNYTAGNWIDITNDEIWLDGTYSWEYKDYSAMQWPCPSGYHIPTSTEFTSLINITTSLFGENNWTNIKTYLKMPTAWSRNYSWDIDNQWVHWRYWSSTWNWTSSYCMFFMWNYTSSVTTNGKWAWYPIRPFKDISVIPDNTWTVLYQWTWNAWVYHHITDWLISISSDWTNWITIADKNLWATTVYNDWDTYSEANCGKYYQRWNNYGFAFTWTLTTSTTKIDAQNYWPWNYYSGDIFITASKNPRTWDSSNNDNLRWWVTWVVQETISWNLVLWDKLYKIVTSTTAPASWTASNIITFVTD